MKRFTLTLCCLCLLAPTACHKKPTAVKTSKPVKQIKIVLPTMDASEPSAISGADASAAATPASTPAVAAAGSADAVSSRPLTPEEIERLRYIVYMFREEYGQFPSALTDLSAKGMLTGFTAPIPNEHIDYNPSTGTLASAK